MKKKTSDRIIKSSLIVAVIVTAGKCVGFIRDAVIAAFYGSNWKTDAFFLAQSMPAIIFPAVCNSISTAFVSLYVKRLSDDEENAEGYASRMLLFTGMLAVALSILGVIFAPLLVKVIAPGFTPEQGELAAHLSRIIMASFVLTMGQYMLTGILNSKKVYYGPQVAAVGYNLTVIVLTFVWGNRNNMDLLTFSVVIGYIIQFILLCLILNRKFAFRPGLRLAKDEAGELLKLCAPILLGNSIVQINNIVDKILASLLESGSVSALSYSNTLNRFVTGIIITTLSSVIYPELTGSFARHEEKEFASSIHQGITMMFIILLPISVITSLCSLDVVSVVYLRGNFTLEAARLTAAALAFYGMMYVFMAVQEISIRVFYAMQDTKTPLKYSAIAVLSNSVISYFLSRIMGIGGIALGTTISTFLASVLLLNAVRSRVPLMEYARLFKTMLKVVVAGAGAAATVIVIKQFGIDNALFDFIVCTVCGFAVYFVLLVLLKCDECRAILGKWSRRSP